MLKKLTNEQALVIAGIKDDVVVVLDPSDIYRVYAFSGKSLSRNECRNLYPSFKII